MPADLTPWSTLASLTQERDAAVAEAAGLRRQVAELLALGVSIHKQAHTAVRHQRGEIVARLARLAAEAYDESMRLDLPQGQRDRADAVADALAAAAREIEQEATR